MLILTVLMSKDDMGLSRGSNIEGGEQGEDRHNSKEKARRVRTGNIILERGRNPSSSKTGLCVVAHLPYVA